MYVSSCVQHRNRCPFFHTRTRYRYVYYACTSPFRTSRGEACAKQTTNIFEFYWEKKKNWALARAMKPIFSWKSHLCCKLTNIGKKWWEHLWRETETLKFFSKLIFASFGVILRSRVLGELLLLLLLLLLSSSNMYLLQYNIKNNSCEIEDSIETHLCRLCVMLRSRILTGFVRPHAGSTTVRTWGRRDLELENSRSGCEYLGKKNKKIEVACRLSWVGDFSGVYFIPVPGITVFYGSLYFGCHHHHYHY